MVRWANFSSRNGWEVHLVSDRQPCEGYDDRVIHHRIHTPASYGVSLPLVTRLWVTMKLIITVKAIEPSIIHAHSIPGYGDYMGLVSRMLPDIRIAVTAWGYSHLEKERSMPLRLLLSKMAVGSADVVTTSVPEMMDLLSQAYGVPRDKLMSFTWGVDLETFRVTADEESRAIRSRLGIPSGAEVMLSPRTMHPHYRIGQIACAASEVIRKNPRVVLILLAGYGSEAYVNEISELVHTLGITENVRIVPKLLAPGEMAEHFNLADFIVQIPSTDQLSATLLEAMACGAIPILSDLDVYRDRFEESTNVLYTETENSSSLANAMQKAVDMPKSKRDAIVMRNRKMIEDEEDFQVNGLKMMRIYENMISGKRVIS
jgi:glycosyltransferase involved in cell wall biosynthesis